MNLKGKIKALATAAAMCVSAFGGMLPEDMGLKSEAASFSYPVQEFRMGISDTNRNISISGTSSGDALNSSKLTGEQSEEWYLNYISSGVYEIVNVATGYVITNNNGTAVISPDTDAANQRWNITAVQQDFEGFDLYYKITSNQDSSLALTFNPEGNTLTTENYSGAAYQKYKLNLNGLEGFAANAKVSGGEKAGTIGGLLGETVFVDTTEECVAAMKRTEPLTIVVTANLEFNDWDQADQKIEDNKTIVGSYSANIIYNSRWRNDDFNGDINITPSNNIVLQNLHFRATELNSNGCGVILVYIYCGRNIWFDHNDFSATFSHNRDVEVGKFIWINTPVDNWSDGCYNGISPDYITLSYNHFNNRYWTVAYGTQNTETTRDRTTLLYNKWENCARRTPQIGNGTGHVYNNYYTYTISDASQQIIAGDGCKMLTEYCYFEGLTGLEFAGGGSASTPFRDIGSVTAANTSSSATAINKSFTYTHNWAPGTENYGYTLISANDTKVFANAYAGSFTSYDNIKYITDSDLSSEYAQTIYPCPFLKDITVTDAKLGAVMNTNVTYVFENANSGLYLEVAGAEAASGANVQQGTTGAVGWTLTDAGSGYYYIYSEVGDGQTYCIDLPYGSTENGESIGIWTNDESDARKFKFIDNGDGTYTIVTKCTKDASAFGVVAGSADEAADVIQWKCNNSDDQKWIANIRMNGDLVSEVLVDNSAYLDGWSFDSSIEVGDLVYPDRDATYVTLPDELSGAEALLIDCDAKNVTTDLASLTAGADISLYVGMDARVSSIPSWLSSWTNTGLTAVNSKDVNFNFYKLDMNAGDTVTLGTNNQSSGCVNYTVFAVQKEVVTTTTTTTTTTITTPIIAEKNYGDSNDNGEVEVADAVFILQGIADPSNTDFALTEEGKAKANCDAPETTGIDAQDALAIQMFMADIIPELPYVAS